MKQTCYGCRALDLERCNLGFKTRTDSLPSRLAPGRYYKEIKPAENCPKPKTYAALQKELEPKPQDRGEA